MGRTKRDVTSANHYHLINRGVDGQDLFAISADWLVFESILDAICAKYRMRIAAYALMSNHFHLLGDVTSCDEPEDLSKAMAELQSGYAKHFNARTSRRGPLFEPRYLGYPVSGATAFARTTRYIHANPIDITGARALAAYRWSSLPVYLARRHPPPWMTTEPLASMIQRESYLAHVTERRPEDIEPLHELNSLERVSLTTLERSLDDVVGRAPTDADQLSLRRLVMMLALDLRVTDVVELAERYGCTPRHVRREAHRARSERVDDPTYSTLADTVRRRAVELASRRSSR